MACWVVPSVASEVWNVPVEQILAAIQSGQLSSKQENEFTFVDVAPGSAEGMAVKATKPKPVTYKIVRPSGPPDSYKLPRPAEVLTPAEMASLTGAEEAAEPSGAMGDWRRGRRNATGRRNPPDMRAA